MRSPFASLFERRSTAITSAHALWEHFAKGFTSLAGVTVNESTSMQVAAVASCVRLIAGTVGALPVDILERVDERTRKPATKHPFRPLLTRPNGWQTWSELIAMLVAHRLLRGNAFIFVVRDSVSGDIVELLPLHPDQVTVEQKAYPSLQLVYTWTTTDGRRFVFTKGEILHSRSLSTNGVMGRSVLEDAREVFGVAIATQQHAATFWARSGLPTVALRHPKTLSDKAMSSLEQHFEATYGGGPDQRRVAVLEEGMEITPLSITAQDSQFLETRQFQRGEIAGLFGVPPHLIGDTEKTTSWGTGIEQQMIGFVTLTLMSGTLVQLEQRFNLDLLKGDPRFQFKFFVQGLLRGDSAARGQWYRVMREIGAYSANDVRRFEDEPPIPNGDTYLQPANLSPLGSVPADRTPAPPPTV